MRIEQTSKAHRDMKMKYLLKPVLCFHCTLSDCRPCFIHALLFMWLWLRLQRRGRSPLTNRQLIILTSLSLSLFLVRTESESTVHVSELLVVIWWFLYFDLIFSHSIKSHQLFHVFVSLIVSVCLSFDFLFLSVFCKGFMYNMTEVFQSQRCTI